MTAALLALNTPAFAQPSVPEIPYESVPNFFKLPPDMNFGEGAGLAVNSKGHVYVNSRVAKFDKNGDWVKSWGEPGTGQGQFNTPHTITSDAQGNIYVGDRGNGRVQVFDGDGRFLREIKISVPIPPGAHAAIGATPNPEQVRGTMAPGAPWAMCITPGQTQYLYVADAFPGRIYKL